MKFHFEMHFDVACIFNTYLILMNRVLESIEADVTPTPIGQFPWIPRMYNVRFNVPFPIE